jgi:ABC transport system ATP-binding/permease protein
VDDYLERVRARRAIPAAATTAPASARSAAPATPGLTPGSAAERSARKELERLERQIERAAARADALHTELAANATDYERLTDLGARLRTVQAEKTDLEERWLEVASALEA